MRKIILDLAVTLDGFIEGPEGETDWCIMDNDMNFETFLMGIDAIFYGRISYDRWKEYNPDSDLSHLEKNLMAIIGSKKKYVFSGSAKTDNDAEYISSDFKNRVIEIREQKGKDIWLFGGAKLISTFIHLDLIDIYRLSVHPVILGKGKPLFDQGMVRVNLELSGVNRFKSGVVQLVYSRSK